jgi:hypothetical protein
VAMPLSLWERRPRREAAPDQAQQCSERIEAVLTGGHCAARVPRLG